MDVNKLMNALDNDNNESIINLTTKKIMEINLNILKELHLQKEYTLDYLKKLKGYRYVDEINELRNKLKANSIRKSKTTEILHCEKMQSQKNLLEVDEMIPITEVYKFTKQKEKFVSQ